MDHNGGGSGGGEHTLIDPAQLQSLAANYLAQAQDALAAGDTEAAAQFATYATQVNQIQHLISGTGGGLVGIEMENLLSGTPTNSQPPPSLLSGPSPNKGKGKEPEYSVVANLLDVPAPNKRRSESLSSASSYEDGASDSADRKKKQRLDASGNAVFSGASSNASSSATPRRKLKVVPVATNPAGTYPAVLTAGVATGNIDDASLSTDQHTAISQMQAAMLSHQTALAAFAAAREGRADRGDPTLPTYVNRGLLFTWKLWTDFVFFGQQNNTTES
jgi:hypothetical protein